MKRATFLYAVAAVAVTASLYLGLGLFLPGCDDDIPGHLCHITVQQHGTYSVTYVIAGLPFTRTVGDHGSGWIDIQGCDSITNVSFLGPASADLQLMMAASPNPAQAGNPMTYTLNVTNKGPNDATMVDLSDTLPSAVSFSQASAPCVQQGFTTVDCPIGGIAANNSAQVQIVVIPKAAGTITNTAKVTSDIPDPDLNSPTTDNKFILKTTVGTGGCTGNADLSVQASNAATMSGGSPFFVFIQTGNFLGPDTAQNVTTTDILSGPANFTSASSDHGTCTMAATVVSCTFGPIPVYPATGSHPDILITVTPTGTGTITNTISVKSDTCDPTPTDGNDTKVLITSSP